MAQQQQQQINGSGAGDFSLDDSKKQGTRLINPLDFLIFLCKMIYSIKMRSCFSSSLLLGILITRMIVLLAPSHYHPSFPFFKNRSFRYYYCFLLFTSRLTKKKSLERNGRKGKTNVRETEREKNENGVKLI
jgi:hypothetical protein